MKFLDFVDKWLEARNENKKCRACEVLEQQLYISNNEKTKLLEQIISLTTPKPAEVKVEEPKHYDSINTGRVPFAVRRQMLEAEDRAKAKILRERAEAENKVSFNKSKSEDITKSNNELEKELEEIAAKAIN